MNDQIDLIEENKRLKERLLYINTKASQMISVMTKTKTILSVEDEIEKITNIIFAADVDFSAITDYPSIIRFLKYAEEKLTHKIN